ncbi:MAG TPA: hypothetical protein VIZ68_08235, partial [Thermoplasmata archaeon]
MGSSIPISNPRSITYDGARGNLFVGTDSGVDVINASTSVFVATDLPVDWPSAMAYDPEDGKVFVSSEDCTGGCGSASPFGLAVINDSTNNVSGFVGLGFEGSYYNYTPCAVVYDNANDFLYVQGVYSLYIVNASSESLVVSIQNYFPFCGMVYDSANQVVYVESAHLGAGSYNCSLLVNMLNGSKGSASPGTFLGSGICVQPYDPAGVAFDWAPIVFDPDNGFLYVVNWWTEQFASTTQLNLSIINGSSNKLLPTTITLPCAVADMVYVGLTEQLYIAAGQNVTIVDVATNQVGGAIGTGQGSSALAYDADLGNLFALNSLSNNITVVPITGPSITSFSANPSVVVLGNTTTFVVGAVNLLGTLSFAYAGLPPGCLSANVSGLTCNATTPGTFVVQVWANNSVGHSASASTRLDVDRYMITSFYLTPNRTAIDTSVTF